MHVNKSVRSLLGILVASYSFISMSKIEFIMKTKGVCFVFYFGTCRLLSLIRLQIMRFATRKLKVHVVIAFPGVICKMGFNNY